jgi:hypothetical protein
MAGSLKNADVASTAVVDMKDEELVKPKHIEETVHKPESIQSMTDEELLVLKKKMVRKMDIVIMYVGKPNSSTNCERRPKNFFGVLTESFADRPIMGILYILNYVDRSALAATKVYGIMEDLNMSTSDFATAISILFGRFPRRQRLCCELLNHANLASIVGYIPFQIPSNLIMTKITRPGLCE